MLFLEIDELNIEKEPVIITESSENLQKSKVFSVFLEWNVNKSNELVQDIPIKIKIM